MIKKIVGEWKKVVSLQSKKYEGEPVTAQEKKMVEILNSDKYIVNLKIQKNSFIAIDPNGKKIITSEGGGSFMEWRN